MHPRIHDDRSEVGEAIRSWAIVVLIAAAMSLWAGATCLLLRGRGEGQDRATEAAQAHPR